MPNSEKSVGKSLWNVFQDTWLSQVPCAQHPLLDAVTARLHPNLCLFHHDALWLFSFESQNSGTNSVFKALKGPGLASSLAYTLDLSQHSVATGKQRHRCLHFLNPTFQALQTSPCALRQHASPWGSILASRWAFLFQTHLCVVFWLFQSLQLQAVFRELILCFPFIAHGLGRYL